MAFKPFVEGGFIDVNPPTDFDHCSVKSVAFCMENPPPDLTFSYKWRLFCQLLYGPKICVVDQPRTPRFFQKRREKKEKSSDASILAKCSVLGKSPKIAKNQRSRGRSSRQSSVSKIFPAIFSTTWRVWSSDR